MILRRFQTEEDIKSGIPVVGCVIYGRGITITNCVACEFVFGDMDCDDVFRTGRSIRLVTVAENE